MPAPDGARHSAGLPGVPSRAIKDKMMTTTTPFLLIVTVFAGLVGLAGCGDGEGEPIPASTCDHPYRVTNEGVEGQTGIAGQLLPKKVTVLVACANSNAAVFGQTVTWTVVSGGGLVNGMSTFMDSGPVAGVATAERAVNWQLGPTLGEQTVRVDYIDPATGTGNSTMFHATAIEGSACLTSAVGTQQAPVGVERVITANETWSLAGSPHRGGLIRVHDGAVLTIEAGATVCVEFLEFRTGARLAAHGTAGAPITFAGSSITEFWKGLLFNPPAFGTTMGASVASFVRIENPVQVLVSAGHPLALSDTSLVRNLPAGTPGSPRFTMGLTDQAGGGVSRMDRVIVDGFGAGADPVTGNPGGPAVAIDVSNFTRANAMFAVSVRVMNSPGDAVHVTMGLLNGTTLTFSNCQLSGNGGNGALIQTQVGLNTVTFSGCNLFDNALAGIRNESTHPIIAQGNWWGDVAGPAAPGGDGTAGDVDASGPLAAPAALGY